MTTTFRLKANEFNNDFIEALKKLFRDNEIEITVSDLSETVEYSKELLQSIQNIEEGKDLISFTNEEFAEYSNKLLKEK
jgi:arsenate reductase-like glutaredoxin family protein